MCDIFSYIFIYLLAIWKVSWFPAFCNLDSLISLSYIIHLESLASSGSRSQGSILTPRRLSEDRVPQGQGDLQGHQLRSRPEDAPPAAGGCDTGSLKNCDGHSMIHFTDFYRSLQYIPYCGICIYIYYGVLCDSMTGLCGMWYVETPCPSLSFDPSRYRRHRW